MSELVKKQLRTMHTDPETGCLYRFVRSEVERTRLHTHEYYEIFLTVEEESIHAVNGTRQLLKEGSLAFVRPTDVHQHVFHPEKKCRLVNITFDEATAQDIFSFLGDGFPVAKLMAEPLPPTVLLHQREKESLLRRMEDLCCIDIQDKAQLKQRLRVLLAQILSVYFSNAVKDDGDGAPQWLETVCERMRQQQNFCEGIDKMVELSGKTREHLARSLKKYYGISTSEFINDLRLNYAANMLKNSSIPVGELCYGCGFQNLSWFYNAFRKKFGITPRQYREIGAAREQ